jgi:hypothetical protein
MSVFADLHCHPVHLNFNKFRARGVENEKTPWDIRESKIRKIKKATRSGYTQSDVAKMIVGGVKIVVASLYPLEQGYFMNSELKSMSEDEIDDIKPDDDLMSGDELIVRKRMAWLAKITTGLSAKRVKQVQNENYDYFNELQPEIDFWISGNNKLLSTTNGIVLKPNNKPKKETIQGKYRILNQANRNLLDDSNNTDLLVVFSIEGSHLLTRQNSLTPIFDRNTILQNVQKIKELPTPIFYLTLAHHFDNGICAHARSIPDLPRIIMPIDQRVNLNRMADGKGISDLGKEIILKLLNLKTTGSSFVDDNLAIGNKILIDVKHMSALARKEYYQLINPYNSQNPSKKIPIIASHVAYSGKRSLDELIANFDSETNKSLSNPDSYLEWNINLCDEDIAEIVNTEGLLGLVFEQRVLGVPFKPLLSNSDLNPDLSNPTFQSKEVFQKQIRAIANAAQVVGKHVFNSDSHSIWNTICIGSDFDGGIDPVQSYPTVLHYNLFRQDLKESLLNGFEHCGINSTNVEVVLDQICFKNCQQFLIKHYPTQNSNPIT